MATWSIWLQPAPVEESIVVSDIGEQWSPNTEPANVAERDIIVKSGATFVHTVAIIGINIPNVPHDVPIENDKNPATINIIGGINIAGILEFATKSPTYSPVLNKSRQTPLIVQANVNIIIAVKIN